MNKAIIDQVPWQDWSSPGGKFHGEGRQLSAALGATTDSATRVSSHPFDLELGRLHAGKSGCPHHSHWTQWELFVILTGKGTVRYGTQQREVGAGDAVMHPPGEAHQLINSGSIDLEYLLIADNPLTDVWHYPDSNKWGFTPNGGIFLRRDVDYFLGEEDGAPQEERDAVPRLGPVDSLARFVRIASIPEELRESPKGTYRSYVRDISLALGGVRDTGTWGGGHPFDLQMRRVPPGAAVCPKHAHTVQSELFVVLDGTATVHANDETDTVEAGEVFFQPPGTAHQIVNTGDRDFVFYVIADNWPADSTYYPNSDKWMLKPQRKVFRMTEVDYFDGEE